MGRCHMWAVACFAAFCVTEHASALPHDIFKFEDLAMTADVVLDSCVVTRIQNSKYQMRRFNAEGNVIDNPNPASQGTWGTLGRLGLSRNNSDVVISTAAGASLGLSNKTGDVLYGISIGMSTRTKAPYVPIKEDMARTYAYLEHNKWGRFEIGTKKGVSKTMKIDADTIAVATGGTDGGWPRYLDVNAYKEPDAGTKIVDKNNFTRGAKLLFNDNDPNSNSEASRKMTYYTPKFNNGMQVGVSYVPDTNHRGADEKSKSMTLLNRKSADRGIKNLIAIAISWNHKLAPNRELTLEVDGEGGTVVRSPADVSVG